MDERTSSSTTADAASAGEAGVAGAVGVAEGAEEEYAEHLSAFCPRFHIAVEIVGRRWSGAILRALLSGHIRYSDLAAAVPGLSDRLLSERLKEFEAEGILDRRVIPETPVRIEYHLTEKGVALEKSFAELARWAEKWVEYAPDAHDRPTAVEGC